MRSAGPTRQERGPWAQNLQAWCGLHSRSCYARNPTPLLRRISRTKRRRDTHRAALGPNDGLEGSRLLRFAHGLKENILHSDLIGADPRWPHGVRREGTSARARLFVHALPILRKMRLWVHLTEASAAVAAAAEIAVQTSLSSPHEAGVSACFSGFCAPRCRSPRTRLSASRDPRNPPRRGSAGCPQDAL